jgi:hypothetical protein
MICLLAYYFVLQRFYLSHSRVLVIKRKAEGEQMNRYEQDIYYIQRQVTELLKLLLKDGIVYEAGHLKQAMEQLARFIYDLTVVALAEHIDIETTLQATRAKMKIAYNLLEQKAISHHGG